MSFEVRGRSADERRYRDTVWRDTRYYFLRSAFPALRLNAIGRTDVDYESPSFADLQDLNESLISAIDAGNERVQNLLASRFLGKDARLTELISDFQDNRMSYLWMNLGRSGAARYVQNLAQLTEVASLDMTRDISPRRGETLEGELDEELNEYRFAGQMTSVVSAALSRLALARPTIHRLSLTLDLAAIRWGLDYIDDDERDSVALPDKGSRKFARELLRLYDIEFLQNDESEATRAIAILLGLEQFDLAADLASHLHRSGGHSATLDLMQTIAIINTSRVHSDAELALTVAYLRDIWNALESESDRNSQTLGIAYGVFTAWARTPQST